MSKKTSHNRNKITSTKITAEQTIIIIRLIRKYKSIWDRNHPEFRKRQIRYNAFKKIGSYFKLTAEDISRKYRRFRNCYIQELKLIRDKKKTYSNLFYFDEMDFLRDQVEHRSLMVNGSSNLRTDPADAGQSEYNFDTDDDEIPIESLEVEDEYSLLEPIEEYQLSSNDSNQSNQEPTEVVVAEEIKEEIPSNIVPVLDVADDECLIEEVQVEKELVNNTTPPNDKSDEFDIFAGYLASQLREMDKLSALETMEELQHIIFKRRIQILKRDHSNNSGHL